MHDDKIPGRLCSEDISGEERLNKSHSLVCNIEEKRGIRESNLVIGLLLCGAALAIFGINKLFTKTDSYKCLQFRSHSSEKSETDPYCRFGEKGEIYGRCNAEGLITGEKYTFDKKSPLFSEERITNLGKCD